MARAVAASAYRHGAGFVDVYYFDPYVKRARIAFAAEDSLSFVPSWYVHRTLCLGKERVARISLSGPTAIMRQDKPTAKPVTALQGKRKR